MAEITWREAAALIGTQMKPRVENCVAKKPPVPELNPGGDCSLVATDEFDGSVGEPTRVTRLAVPAVPSVSGGLDIERGVVLVSQSPGVDGNNFVTGVYGIDSWSEQTESGSAPLVRYSPGSSPIDARVFQGLPIRNFDVAVTALPRENPSDPLVLAFDTPESADFLNRLPPLPNPSFFVARWASYIGTTSSQLTNPDFWRELTGLPNAKVTIREIPVDELTDSERPPFNYRHVVFDATLVDGERRLVCSANARYIKYGEHTITRLRGDDTRDAIGVPNIEVYQRGTYDRTAASIRILKDQVPR